MARMTLMIILMKVLAQDNDADDADDNDFGGGDAYDGADGDE